MIIASLSPVAEQQGLKFLGVGCKRFRVRYEHARWLTLDKAIWTLRHYADTGQSGPISYVFGFSGSNLPVLARALTDLGMTTEFYQPESENHPNPSAPPALPLLLARITGDGSDNDITARHTQAEQAAAAAHAEFEGMTVEGVGLPE